MKKYPEWGECIFSNENPKSFKVPKVGPGSQPIWADFIQVTPLCFIGKDGQKIWGLP